MADASAEPTGPSAVPRALSRRVSDNADGWHEHLGSPTMQGLYGGSVMQLNTNTCPSVPITAEHLDSFSRVINDEEEGDFDSQQQQPLLSHQSSISSTRRSVAGITAVTPPISPALSAYEFGSRAGSESRGSASGKAFGAAGRLLDARSLLFGCVNAAITLPVMIAFCKVIFQEPEFQPYQGKLVRLVFLSAATHQLVFTCRSCVPGAVGQVQDVGLIFLSAIATAVVARGRDSHADFQDTLASVLLLLTLTTMLVGVMVVIVARCKLANLVQYVPVPVVGGYLAYVGFFIGVSGLELACNSPLKTMQQALALFSTHAMARLAPAVAAWQLFSKTVRYFPNPVALPLALVSVVLVFYAVLYATGHSIGEAQQAGWLPLPDKPMPHFWEVWELFQVQDWPANIDWGAIPSLLPNLFALFIVVSFGSCMDIAAIQAQSSDELDFNNELELIGMSNAVVGLAGVGYTGSYIFSQTLFNLKFGASGISSGMPIILSELAMMMLPSSPVQYIPNFFFGGLMVWLGVDIMYDWLATSLGKLRRIEYGLIWVTFFLVTYWGLETGIVAGILCAMAVFAFEYSQLSVTCFNVSASRSSYMRTYQHRWVLDQLSSNMVALSLSGYIFFGSVTTLSEKAMLISDLLINSGLEALEEDEFLSPQAQINKVKMYAPKTLLLDFRKVTGFDATAAQAFKVLRQRLEKQGVEMIITHIPPSRMYIHHLLVAYGVAASGDICTATKAPPAAPAGCLVFDGLNSGLHYCEEQLLQVAVEHGICQAMVDDLPLHALLKANWSESWQEQSLLPAEISGDFEDIAASMLPFLEVVKYTELGSTVFERGDRAGEIYLIQTGIISCEVDVTHTRSVGHKSSLLLQTRGSSASLDNFNLLGHPQSPSGSHHSSGASPQATSAGLQQEQGANVSPVGLVEYGPGGILGDLDYFLQRKRYFSAKVTCVPCHLWRFSQESLVRMAAEAPKSLLLLQTIILRASALSSSHAVEALEMSRL